MHEVSIESKMFPTLPMSCWRPAKWKNLRWSNTAYCDHCKEQLSKYYTNDWTIIEEGKDGK